MNAFNITKKTLCTLLLGLAITNTGFAASKDLKIFRTLLKVGAQSEQFMSQIHIGLDKVECAYSNVSGTYSCQMTDISAADGQGAPLELSGRKAKAVFQILGQAGAPSDGGMGKIYISADAIRCSQAVDGVADGSESDRTACDVFFPEQN